MKRLLGVCVCLVFMNISVFAQQKLESNIDSISYSIGLNIGKSLEQGGMDSILINKLLIQGLSDYLMQKQLLINSTEAEEIARMFYTKLRQEQMDKEYKDVKEAGEAFLKQNKNQEGVITLESGLQYQILTAGEGVSPLATDIVVTHYKGTLIDGTVFDSSYDRGEPASFPVNGVIVGWQEALKLMKPGAKWKLFIPSELAYGSRSAGKHIKPFSTLIFEIELIEVNPK